MIKSITGYGQGRASGPMGMFNVQVQAVNRKYLEIFVNMDREFLELENFIRQRAGNVIHRGRVNIFIEHELPAEQHSRVVLNKRLAREYLAAFHNLQKEFHLSGSVDLRTLVQAKDVVEMLETHPDKKKLAPVLYRALDEALRQMDTMRVREGKNLEKDFRSRLRKLAADLRCIKRQVPKTLKNYQDKYRLRLKEMQGKEDPERLQRDTASFGDKVDISEEIVRFESHIAQFHQILDNSEPKGKALDFLMQEMIREANTIGSKANDLVISKTIITIKSDLEKIREQVQNIE